MLYYITDRSQFPGDEPTRRRLLLDKITEAARCGVDYIQLREKDLSSRALETLAQSALGKLRIENRERKTALLINSRPDIALAVNAQGVHLRSQDIKPSEVLAIWKNCTSTRPTVAVSCHTPDEVAQAASDGADFAVFAPVFNKGDSLISSGLEALRRACQHRIPVLALGGVTVENAGACIEAGAAGIAAIRLFQENNIAEVVATLRALT